MDVRPFCFQEIGSDESYPLFFLLLAGYRGGSNEGDAVVRKFTLAQREVVMLIRELLLGNKTAGNKADNQQQERVKFAVQGYFRTRPPD